MKRSVPRRLARKFTYANVMATIAVFVALGGTSYAAIVITGANVKNGSITGADVKDGSLTSKDLGAAFVKSLHGKDGVDGTDGVNGRDGTNGHDGTKGVDGLPGAPGAPGAPAAITDLTQLNDAACTVNAHPGTISSAVGGAGVITLTCVQTPLSCGTQPTAPANVAMLSCNTNSGTWQIATCSAGFYNGDGQYGNGCEINLMTSGTNCGSPGHNITNLQNVASVACTNGVAVILSCFAGYANGDGNVDTGCETNLMTDVNNCGTVHNVVPTYPFTMPHCVSGSASWSCLAGHYDKDNDMTNGCESTLP